MDPEACHLCLLFVVCLLVCLTDWLVFDLFCFAALFHPNFFKDHLGGNIPCQRLA
jgi:hypothetical protein